MNTQMNTPSKLKTGRVLLNKILLTSVFLFSAMSVQAENSYQQRVLFTPSHSILLAEARGRIMIYDGVKSESVDKAMDEQFDRIETMMFVNTLYKQEDGEYMVENDDCD